MAAHANCILCGQYGTLAHRVFYCPGWTALRDQMLPLTTRGWLAEVLPGLEKELAMGHFPLSAVVQPTATAPTVNKLGQSGKLTGDIFVDGSAFRPRDKYTRRAGFSLIQMDGHSPQRVLWGALPKDAGTHSAALAEDYAVTRLAQYAELPIHVYCDCQRTVDILKEGPNGHKWRRVAHAHLWHELWQVHNCPIPCTKVVAHATWSSMH
eukprot:3968061-Amphidinium_carterae.1